jgi:hypothetical protein
MQFQIVSSVERLRSEDFDLALSFQNPLTSAVSMFEVKKSNFREWQQTIGGQSCRSLGILPPEAKSWPL